MEERIKRARKSDEKTASGPFIALSNIISFAKGVYGDRVIVNGQIEQLLPADINLKLKYKRLASSQPICIFLAEQKGNLTR